MNKNNLVSIDKLFDESGYNKLNNDEKTDLFFYQSGNVLEEEFNYDKKENEERIKLISKNSLDGELNKLIKYYKKISEYPVLSIEEQRNVYDKMKNGNLEERVEARKQLIIGNMRLVPTYIIRHFYHTSTPVTDIDDIIQEGNLILMDSIDNYDINKGKLSTIFYLKMYQSLKKNLLEKGFNRKMPLYLKGISTFIDRCHKQEMSRDKIIAYICIKYNVDDKMANSLYNSSFLQNLDDIEIIEDDLEDTVLDSMMAPKLKKVIKEEMGKLSFRENAVLNLRFGFEDGKTHSVENIAKKYGVNTYKIRKCEASGLRNMRKIEVSDRLREFMYGKEPENKSKNGRR